MKPPSGWRTAVSGWRKGRGAGPSRSTATNKAWIVDGEMLSKLDRISLVLGRDLMHGLMGEHLAVRRTIGIEFADYRPYSPGDDLRRVDWNAYARLGSMHIRQAQAEHDTVLYLLVDASPSMQFGSPSKFDAARRLAAAFGYVALAHLDRVVVASPGAHIAEARQVVGADYSKRFRGRAESGSLFKHLQELSGGEVANFAKVLAEWATRSLDGRGAGRVAVVISDLLMDDDYRTGLKHLVSAGFGVNVLHVLNTEEMEPGEEGDYRFLDSETGEQLEVHLGSEGLAEYRRRLNNWLEEIEGWCNQNGVLYQRVLSDWDVERVMLDTLRRRGVTA